jgi:DNA-binding Lrp family transcriptional regulator
LGAAFVKTIFVQVKCEPGRAYEVAAHLVDYLEPVPEVHSTSGQWDLLIRCNLPAEVDIGRFVTEKIQTVKGIRETFTTVAYKAFVNDGSE